MGVGANIPAYESSWNTYDRLVTYGVYKDTNGNAHYDPTKFRAGTSGVVGYRRHVDYVQAEEKRQIPRRLTDYRQGRQMVL